MWFRAVDGIMLPAAGLLYADGSPFVFAEETCFGESFCEFFGENYVSKLLQFILVRAVKRVSG